MNSTLAQEAITHALNGEWEKALEINNQIVATNPDDVDALNRIARAYSELGDIKKAREIVQKVLAIDPFNTIAKKARDRWQGLKNGEVSSSSPVNSQVFLEEPGKTKIISLMHLGSPESIAELDAGDEVEFNSTAHRVSVCNKNGKYIGRLQDDLSARLRSLITLGYEYKIFIKSVDKNEIKVIIREQKRPIKFADNPSFTAEKINYVSFTSPELLNRQDNEIEDDAEDISEE
jgi:tetratricopeptide (TPR) repeat protein